MPEAPLIVRGGRAIPPREVERVLRSHPAVAEAAVAGVPDLFWGEIVGAAVRLSAPLPSAARDLAAYCRGFLPGYQVPERWLFTGALPRTARGDVCQEQVTARLTVSGAPWLALVDPVDLLRPRPPVEDLRIPHQVRRSGSPDGL